MTRFARVGEGRKRPLDATEWKDMNKKNTKKLKKATKSLGDSRGDEEKSAPAKGSENSNTQDVQTPPVNQESTKPSPIPTSDFVGNSAEKQHDKPKQDTDVTVSKSKISNKECDHKKKKFDGNKQKHVRRFGKEKKGLREMECYNCHKMGHKVSDCPEPSDGKMDSVECFKCRQKGHKSFKCPNKEHQSADIIKPKVKKSSIDFTSFSKDFKHQWERKTGFLKALREEYKANEKITDKSFSQFKKEFSQSWSKKMGFSKALREEWKKHGKELKQQLRKQERSEQRRLKRADQRETEKVP